MVVITKGGRYTRQPAETAVSQTFSLCKQRHTHCQGNKEMSPIAKAAFYQLCVCTFADIYFMTER